MTTTLMNHMSSLSTDKSSDYEASHNSMSSCQDIGLDAIQALGIND